MASKLSLAVIGLVAIVGGLGTGLSASMTVAAAQNPEGEAAGDPEAVAELRREQLVMEELVINIAESGGGRLLRLHLQLEGSLAAVERCEALLPRIQDDVNRSVSDWSYGDLEGANGKNNLRNALHERINGIIEPEQLDHVYFLDFVVQ